MCELDSRVTEVQDNLWQLQATVGRFGSLVQVARGPTGKRPSGGGTGRTSGYNGSFEGRGAKSDPYYYRRAQYVLWRTCRMVVRYRSPALPRYYLSDAAPPRMAMRALRGSPCSNLQLQRNWA